MIGSFRKWKCVLGFAFAILVVGCDSNQQAADTPVASKPGAETEAPNGEGTESSDLPEDTTRQEPKPAEPNLAESVGTDESVEPDVNDARFHEAINKVADEYLQYSLVNTQFDSDPAPRIANAFCRGDLVQPADSPSQVTGQSPDDTRPGPRMSSTGEDVGHGKKLYFLFANDIVHYTARDGSKSPVGQALVKESWSSQEGNPNARNLRTHAAKIRVNPRVRVGEKTLEIGQRTNLFVMTKLNEETAGTDEGWIYGVVDADSRRVKFAGAVASCIACHDGQEDRLFRDGIPKRNEEVVGESE